MKRRIYILSSLAFGLLLMSCEKDDDALASFDCTNTNPTYTGEIKALLDLNCATASCHSSSSQAGGINLSNYISSENESSNARFLGAINQISPYVEMPRNASKLSDDDIKTLTCWVDNGSPE